MDRRRAIALAGAGLGGCLIAYAVLGEESREERIRAVLFRFAESVSLDVDQTNPLARAAQVNGAFKEIVDKQVRASVPELPNLRPGREGLASAAIQTGALFRSAQVEFSQLNYEIGELSARVSCLGHLVAVDRGGEPRRDERSVHFELMKQDGDWWISSIAVSERAAD